MKHAVVQNGLVTNVVLASPDFGQEQGWIPCPEWVSIGDYYAKGEFSKAPPADPLVPAYARYIDVGPFFDRFGAKKMAVLSSSNSTVQALLRDIQTRKWVDLNRADVAQGIGLLVALELITEEEGAAVIEPDVSESEQFALVRVYFS